MTENPIIKIKMTYALIEIVSSITVTYSNLHGAVYYSPFSDYKN